MREKIDVYNKNREKTGKIVYRGDPLDDDQYRLVVHAVIFNMDKQILCQKRSITKAGYPLFWDISCGGCVQAGESSNEAIQREILEELGVEIDFSLTRPAYSFTNMNTFDDYYYALAEYSIDDFTLQESEVVRVQWFSLEEIKQMLDTRLFCDYINYPKIVEVIEAIFQQINSVDES